MWKCPKYGREFKNAEQSHFCAEINTIDDYTADRPAEVRALLQAVRETIRAAAPDATEKILRQIADVLTERKYCPLARGTGQKR